MKEISNYDMKKVEGGMSEVVAVSLVVGAITLVIGIFSGYSNPVKCNN